MISPHIWFMCSAVEAAEAEWAVVAEAGDVELAEELGSVAAAVAAGAHAVEAPPEPAEVARTAAAPPELAEGEHAAEAALARGALGVAVAEGAAYR